MVLVNGWHFSTESEMSFRPSRSIFRVSTESLVFQPSVLINYGVSTESLRVSTESPSVSTESPSVSTELLNG